MSCGLQWEVLLVLAASNNGGFTGLTFTVGNWKMCFELSMCTCVCGRVGYYCMDCYCVVQ